MRIAILSDTHGRQSAIHQVLHRLHQDPVDLLLHCGDIDDADTVWCFPSHTHFVFGNCDQDKKSLRQAIRDLGATLHEPFGQLELAGQRIAFLHGDEGDLFRNLTNSGQYDYLFFGHTHQAENRMIGKTRVINPGALHRAPWYSFAILDLQNGELRSVLVQ